MESSKGCFRGSDVGSGCGGKSLDEWNLLWEGEYLQTKNYGIPGCTKQQKLSPVNGGFCEGKLQIWLSFRIVNDC